MNHSGDRQEPLGKGQYIMTMGPVVDAIVVIAETEGGRALLRQTREVGVVVVVVDARREDRCRERRRRQASVSNGDCTMPAHLSC